MSSDNFGNVPDISRPRMVPLSWSLATGVTESDQVVVAIVLHSCNGEFHFFLDGNDAKRFGRDIVKQALAAEGVPDQAPPPSLITPDAPSFWKPPGL